MTIFRATIELFVQADSEAEACDAIAETMRDHLRKYAPSSAILDWQYESDPYMPQEATNAQLMRIAAQSPDWPLLQDS